jgi:hypothetical protein
MAKKVNVRRHETQNVVFGDKRGELYERLKEHKLTQRIDDHLVSSELCVIRKLIR